jgi:hypothetical protein
VIVWLPAESVLVVGLVAIPAARGTGMPKFVPSIWNWTVPVGIPRLGVLAAIVAVKLTGWLKTEGLADELIVAVAVDMVRLKTTLVAV